MLDSREKSPRKRGVFPSFFAHFWAKMGDVDNLSVTFFGAKFGCANVKKL